MCIFFKYVFIELLFIILQLIKRPLFHNPLCIALIMYQLNYRPIIALSQIAIVWKEYCIVKFNRIFTNRN